jgi:hypothetical protein
MTTRPPTPFAVRLAPARRLVAGSAPPVPVNLGDQLDAAGREVLQIHDRLGAVLPMLVPGRRRQHRADAAPSDEIRAYLLAAILACTTVCAHVRRGGPRPVIAGLALRRLDCDRCLGTLRRSVTAEDECDVCELRGVVVFHPFPVRIGPALLVGDACRSCVAVLGIRFAGVAS